MVCQDDSWEGQRFINELKANGVPTADLDPVRLIVVSEAVVVAMFDGIATPTLVSWLTDPRSRYVSCSAAIYNGKNRRLQLASTDQQPKPQNE